MRILVTGASGFLGNALMANFKEHEILTLAKSNADVVCDISHSVPPLPECDTVIHCAGKAHSMPRSNEQEREFFAVNVTGTENLLHSLELSLPRSFVFISSVSVYGLFSGSLISELAPLLAKDPYGLSKIKAEQIVEKWCNKNDVKCTILRLPLLVGHNPPGNLATMINALRKGYYFNIGGGTAKKSMVLVDDVAMFILKAAAVGGIYNLTDGHHPTFSELSKIIAKQIGKHTVLNLSSRIAVMAALVGDLLGEWVPLNSAKMRKMTATLTFDDSKARANFGWNPRAVTEGFKL